MVFSAPVEERKMDPPTSYMMSRFAEIAMTDDSDSDEALDSNSVPATGTTSSKSFTSDLSRNRTICVVTQSHKEPQIEPLHYVLLQLQEQECSKVVVVVCLTKIMDEMGLWRRMDVQSFSGTNQKKLKLRRQEAVAMWNHFLATSGFRRKLLELGISLEVCVAAGFPKEDVLTEATRAIQPHLIVLDRSFAGSKSEKALQKLLECTVVLVTRSEKEKILKLTAHSRLPSLDRSDRGSDLLEDQFNGVNRTSELHSKSPNVRSGGSGHEVSDVTHWRSPVTGNQGNATFRKSPAVSSIKVDDDGDNDYALCICVCDSPSPGGQRKILPSSVPTKGSVVLYEDRDRAA